MTVLVWLTVSIAVGWSVWRFIKTPQFIAKAPLRVNLTFWVLGWVCFNVILALTIILDNLEGGPLEIIFPSPFHEGIYAIGICLANVVTHGAAILHLSRRSA